MSLGGALIESGAWDRARDVLAEAEATAQRAAIVALRRTPGSD